MIWLIQFSKIPKIVMFLIKKLQDEAFNIVGNTSSSLKDNAEAGLVGGVMLAKRKLGLGVRQKR